MKKLIKDLLTLDGEKWSLARVMLWAVFISSIIIAFLPAIAIDTSLVFIFSSLLGYSFLDKSRNDTAKLANRKMDVFEQNTIID